MYSRKRIKTIAFLQGRSALGVAHRDTERYFFRNADEIYADKIARFVLDCQEKSYGLVTKRLSEIYDGLFIDEFQDMAGYDLDVLDLFMRSGFWMIMVGDPRQTIYATNPAAKNKQYRGIGILRKAAEWEAANLCRRESCVRNFRCTQAICRFADALWPDMATTESYNHDSTGHDGVFLVSRGSLDDYVKRFTPQVLRYNIRSASRLSAMNFGVAKGLQFDRVLIIPNDPIKKYLRTGEVGKLKEQTRAKFYVAVTRAKHSVALLYEGECACECRRWECAGS